MEISNPTTGVARVGMGTPRGTAGDSSTSLADGTSALKSLRSPSSVLMSDGTDILIIYDNESANDEDQNAFSANTAFFNHNVNVTGLALLVTHSGVETKTDILLENILGVSFDLHSDMMREHIEGTVTIVVRQPNYPLKFWQKWIRVPISLVVFACCVCYVLGPVSAALLTTALSLRVLLPVKRAYTQNQQLMVDSPRKPHGKAVAQNQAVKLITIPAYFSLVTNGVSLCSSLTYTLRLHGVNVSAGVTCMTCLLLMTIVSYITRSSSHCNNHNNNGASNDGIIKQSIYLAVIKSHFAAEIELPSLPMHPEPFVVHYAEDSIQAMVDLRAAFYRSSLLRPLVLSRWLGSGAVESILSNCLPSSLYNSTRFRQGLFIVLYYLVPLYSVARGLGALLPHFGSAYDFLRADVGLDLIGRVVDYYSILLREFMWGEWSRLWALISTRCTDVLLRFAFAGRVVRFSLHWTRVVVQQSNRFLFSYILPNNVYLEYLRSRLLIVQITCAPLLAALATVAKSTLSALYPLYSLLAGMIIKIASVSSSIASALYGTLVQPMPQPSVMAVGSNVVGASSKLVTTAAINITPKKESGAIGGVRTPLKTPAAARSRSRSVSPFRSSSSKFRPQGCAAASASLVGGNTTPTTTLRFAAARARLGVDIDTDIDIGTNTTYADTDTNACGGDRISTTTGIINSSRTSTSDNSSKSSAVKRRKRSGNRNTPPSPLPPSNRSSSSNLNVLEARAVADNENGVTTPVKYH